MSRRGRAAPNMMKCAYYATLAPVHRSSYRARGSSCSSRVGLSAKAHSGRVAVRTARSTAYG